MEARLLWEQEVDGSIPSWLICYCFMAKPNQRRKLFNDNPHCFWCGRLTVFHEDSIQPENGATVDHIRSKYCVERPQKNGRKWKEGFIVLSCYRCNQLRSKIESAFFRELESEFFFKKGNARPARKSLTKSQAIMCGYAFRFIRQLEKTNPDLLKTKIGNKFFQSSKILMKEYKDRKKNDIHLSGPPVPVPFA